MIELTGHEPSLRRPMMKIHQSQLPAAALCLALLGCSNGDATKNEMPPRDFGEVGRTQTSPSIADAPLAPAPQQRTKEGAESVQAPPPKAPLAVLSGIVELRDKKYNLAVLALGDEEAQLLRSGDRVTDEWSVDSVDSSKVVLVAQSGHSHTVLLGANARPHEALAPVVPPPPPPPPKPDQFMIKRAAAEFNMPEND